MHVKTKCTGGMLVDDQLSTHNNQYANEAQGINTHGSRTATNEGSKE